MINVFNYIENGKKGNNIYVDFTLDKLNNYIKIWKGRYYLIFALSGVGKSKFAYHQFIFNVIDKQINHNFLDWLKIDLYSLEISSSTVIGNAIIYYLKKYRNIVTDINQLFSYTEKIPDKLYKETQRQELKEYIKEVEKYLNIEHILTFGKLKRNINTTLKELGNIKRNERNDMIQFEPKTTRYLYEIVIDHISLTSLIQGKSRYETIGIISKYLFYMRNIAGITPVIIQQVNPDRKRELKDTVSPNHEDLRDNKETFNDCDIGIAIGSPFKHKIHNFNGYRIYPSTVEGIQGLQDRFRFIEIRKNRYGSGANRAIPALFIGETSTYHKIPAPEDLKTEQYLKIENIKKTYE